MFRLHYGDLCHSPNLACIGHLLMDPGFDACCSFNWEFVMSTPTPTRQVSQGFTNLGGKVFGTTQFSIAQPNRRISTEIFLSFLSDMVPGCHSQSRGMISQEISYPSSDSYGRRPCHWRLQNLTSITTRAASRIGYQWNRLRSTQSTPSVTVPPRLIFLWSARLLRFLRPHRLGYGSHPKFRFDHSRFSDVVSGIVEHL